MPIMGGFGKMNLTLTNPLNLDVIFAAFLSLKKQTTTTKTNRKPM